MICCFARPSMEMQITHSVLSSSTLVGRTVSLSEGADGSSQDAVHVSCLSRRSCSRASCLLRLLQPANVGMSQLWENAWKERLLCVVWSQALLTYGNWYGGPKNFQSPNPFRVIK